MPGGAAMTGTVGVSGGSEGRVSAWGGGGREGLVHE